LFNPWRRAAGRPAIPFFATRTIGTDASSLRFVSMNEPLPMLMENSIQIAWDYLEATGELGDGHIAARFLMDSVEMMISRGERRKLLLSNRAIDAYRKFRAERSRFTLVS
jgi:hypothetical protein